MGLGFSAAWDTEPGGKVVYGGTVWEVVEVIREGKDAPYFRLLVCEKTEFLPRRTVVVSWQNCDSVVDLNPKGDSDG